MEEVVVCAIFHALYAIHYIFYSNIAFSFKYANLFFDYGPISKASGIHPLAFIRQYSGSAWHFYFFFFLPFLRLFFGAFS